MQHPLMRVLDGAGEAALTGEEVLTQVAELIADRLPLIPFHDPDRGQLVALQLAVPPVAQARAGRRADR